MRVIPVLWAILLCLPRCAAAPSLEFNQDFSCQHPSTIFLLDRLLQRAESRWEFVEKAESRCPCSEVRLLVEHETRRDNGATFMGAAIQRASGACFLIHPDLRERGRWTIEGIPMARVGTYMNALAREIAALKRSPSPDRTPEEIAHMDRILASLRQAVRGQGYPELAALLKEYPRVLPNRPRARHDLPAGIVPV